MVVKGKNAVGWFEIYVDDINRAKKFYESVFQCNLDAIKSPVEGLEMWSFKWDDNVYGAPGALVKMPDFKPNGNSVLIYFTCEDCAVEEKRVTESGGKVDKSKFQIGEYGFISLVFDTEGNMIGLHSLK